MATSGSIGEYIGRGVAQAGSAPQWGCGGRRFESSRPDHFLIENAALTNLGSGIFNCKMVGDLEPKLRATKSPREILDALAQRVWSAGPNAAGVSHILSPCLFRWLLRWLFRWKFFIFDAKQYRLRTLAIDINLGVVGNA